MADAPVKTLHLTGHRGKAVQPRTRPHRTGQGVQTSRDRGSSCARCVSSGRAQVETLGSAFSPSRSGADAEALVPGAGVNWSEALTSSPSRAPAPQTRQLTGASGGGTGRLARCRPFHRRRVTGPLLPRYAWTTRDLFPDGGPVGGRPTSEPFRRARSADCPWSCSGTDLRV